jgi:hypothetical protein
LSGASFCFDKTLVKHNVGMQGIISEGLTKMADLQGAKLSRLLRVSAFI